MENNEILSNKPIPISLSEKIKEKLSEDRKILFAVAGDLSLDANYADCALAVTEDSLICAQDSPGDSFFISFADINKIEIRRMYSNAVLKCNGKIVLRFSFCVVSVMEAAIAVINKLISGIKPDEAVDIITAIFEKEQNFCSKCGRALTRPGAECINCMSKGKLIKRLGTYLKPHIGKISVSIFLSLFTTAASLFPPYITKTLVDDVLPESDYKLLLILVLILISLYILQGVVGAIRSYILMRVSDRLVTDLRNDVYKKAQYLPMSFYDRTSTGSMYTRISNDTNTINSFLLQVNREAIVQFCLMVGIMVIMFVLNWRLALLSLIPVPIVALGARSLSKKVRPVYRKIWMRWSYVCSILSDSLPGIKVIKSFTGEKRSIDKFGKHNNIWYDENKKAVLVTSWFPQVVSFFVNCGSLVIWGVGGSWVIDGTGDMTVGLLVSFISYAAMFYGPINYFANLSTSYQQALTSGEKLLDILDAEPEKDFGKGNKIDTIKGKIEFKNVTFSFDKTDKTLDNINLTIEPGDVVGIVGTTGSGKTTLINLLMRFYDDYDGEIFIDGKNIKNIDLESFRSNIGFVQQEPLMFRDTIFNNIAFSNPDASVEEVITAADTANVHGFVARMPDSYDTVLGERGAGLSGGEKQRISIARAVIKNPSMLIFDEATASVDSETEHFIQEAIERLISGRTTIMIAHRLSTLKKANKIVVVDNGKIIEMGTPKELMALKGKYYQLIEIQSMSEEANRKRCDGGFS